MKTITNLLVAIVATLTAASMSNAQEARFATQAQGQMQQQAQQGQQALLVQPSPSPAVQNQYYFGMQVELIRDGWGQTKLRVVSVTPGSPAQRAGLEYGDQIKTVNGRGFRFARDSYDAVRMMNQYVSFSGGTAPAAAAAAQTMISPWPQPSRPFASMVVRNVRNGQFVNVTVNPERRFGGGGGAPAAAASAATGS